MAPPNGTESLSGTCSEGLSFLVTHWLANFETARGGEVGARSSNTNEEQRRALEKIRHASAEIASAFSTLGAFGTTRPPSFSNSLTQEIVPQNATYSDVRRRWNTLSSSHLEQIANAVVSTNAAVLATSGDGSSGNGAIETNLLMAVTESSTREKLKQVNGATGSTTGGRTAQDAIAVDDSQNESSELAGLSLDAHSILQPPLQLSRGPNASIDFLNIKGERPRTPPPMMLPVRSRYTEVAQRTFETMRKLLELRVKVQSVRQEIKVLNDSMVKQAETVTALEEKYRLLNETDMTRMLEVIDEVKAGKQECERVTAQLQRKVLDLSSTLQKDELELRLLEDEITLLDYTRRKGIVPTSRDSIWSWQGQLAPGSRIGANPILQSIVGRQQGLSRPRNNSMFARSSIIHGPSEAHFVTTRKALLASRLSHAATINAHISFPVYCLRFDRTGRYFISGADDYLVKVFHLGCGQSKQLVAGSRNLRCNYGANLRGAVLVSTLRGHAGVINDIDVSSDNAFLATASVDGDVRVWGLKDGCPVAILRGHKGGANMVSWSKLTPYRLVSSGTDGFARSWDIREACLKRYGAQVGKRQEYHLQLTDKEIEGLEQGGGGNSHTLSREQSGTPLPTLPIHAILPAPVPAAAAALGDGTSASQPSQHQNESVGIGLVVPPLPAAVPPLPHDIVPNNAPQVLNPENEIAPSGQFVANDEIDEGVKLLSKYKHGSIEPEVVGPGTRSRRAAVNVICVARCPSGMYFATGSDDGMCRVFEDDEDPRVAIVDGRAVKEHFSSNTRHHSRGSRTALSSDEPVLILRGHISAITDLAYSRAGNMILSASQKDGVVRIWSLGKPPLEQKDHNSDSQIVVKLTDPRSRGPSKPSRRTQGGANRNDSSKVSCDAAVWTHDDSKIITAQSVLVKQNDSDIQPGSQYLFLWDSRSGQCLLGISGAHTMQCPVVVPHPTDSTLVLSAGADGFARIWDWESGRCIFTHSNKVEYGPVEPTERGKLAGYLDGSFSPDGTTIVLTDDCGRLTILDSNARDVCSLEQPANAWMREQYFANDYYDLCYDLSGYCIERGSAQPPHLAPKGVRCNHAGSPWSDDVNSVFSKLAGPSPLAEQIARWRRDEIRRAAVSALESINTVSEKHACKVRKRIREFDPLSTVVIQGPGHVTDAVNHPSKEQSNRIATFLSTPSLIPRINASPRNMSANFSYLDYDDMIRENQEEEDHDSDDEEFSPTARNRGAMDNSDDSDHDMDELETESSFASRSRNRRDRVEHGERRVRARRRSQHRNDQFVEIDSDDENAEQIMSTNNTPSGQFVEDYRSHFWRMPVSNVRRKWLQRMESDTSYEGRKIYTPQLGDSVVYIARAHYETINGYPSLEPPWQHWPQGTAWPVVRCCVRGARFRFPYEDYYRSNQSKCKSLVAILTLEVTGIPELSDNREFPWPKPDFIESTGAYVFELSVFENDECEFILPEGLYTERLKTLEAALRERNSAAGLTVSVNYQTLREDEPMEVSQGQIETFVLEENPTSDPHMKGSGFGVVKVTDSSGWSDDFSPWDISMANFSISRPHLSDEEKALVSEKLNAQCRKDIVARHFNVPVDVVRYCDYERMVEVAMDLMTVKGRIQADYYASKFSVIQDLRLIRDNCIKYNGAHHELVEIAKAMCEEFETGVLTDEEASILRESDDLMLSSKDSPVSRRAPTIRINLHQRTSLVSAHNRQPNQERLNSRSNRLRRQSLLEFLPAPEPPSGHSVRRGRATIVLAASAGRRTRSMDSNQVIPVNQRRSSRLRAPPLESLSQLDRNRPIEHETMDTADNSVGRGQRASRSTRQSALDHAPDNSQIRNSADSQPNQRASRSVSIARSEINREDHDSQQQIPPRASNSPSHRSSPNNPVAQKESEDVSPESVGESDLESQIEEYDQESAASEPEDQSDSDATPPRKARKSTSLSKRSSPRRKTRRHETRSSPRTKRAPVAASNHEEPEPRKSRRTRNKTSKASYKDETSDFELSEDDLKDDSEEEMQNSRKRTCKVKSYTELPSDFEEDEEITDDEGAAGNARQKRKRQASSASREGSAKKSKALPPQQKPRLKSWPKIDMKLITPICDSLIARVAKEDSDGNFSIPVLEAFPELKEFYLEVVECPMDLRTIKEDRIHQYENIKQLQDDLKLMLENCCDFNGVETQFGQYAINIWNQLNAMFVEVCKEQGVKLGNWRP